MFLEVHGLLFVTHTKLSHGKGIHHERANFIPNINRKPLPSRAFHSTIWNFKVILDRCWEVLYNCLVTCKYDIRQRYASACNMLVQKGTLGLLLLTKIMSQTDEHTCWENLGVHKL